jgi:hypothetical protein
MARKPRPQTPAPATATKPTSPSPHSNRQLLVLGVAQAVGFFAGAVLGRGLGMLLGLDAFAPEGYSGRAIAGIALIGLGGGAGVQAARLWYIRRHGDPKV